MKKVLGIFLSSVLSAAALTGCYKDLGGYDYKDINALKVATDMTGVDPNVFITQDSIDLHQNDSLKVKLKIDQSVGSAENFSYQWMFTQYSASNPNPSKNIIATTSSLATKITFPPNVYRLVAKVTDKTTGVSYYKSFALNVSAAEWGNEGWIVLQDEADGSDISVITTRDGSVKGKVFHNVYSSFNGHKLPVGTYRANVVNYVTVLRAQKVSFLYPNGGIQVRSTDFADSTKSDYWISGLSGPMNIQANGSAGGSSAGWEYVIVNNQIAYRQVASAAQLSNPPMFFPPYAGLSVSPYVIHAASSDQYYTLYDKDNRRFLVFRADNSTVTNMAAYSGVAANLNPTTGSGFDFSNMKDNLIHAENAQPFTTANPYWNCFFRTNAGDNTYLVQFQRQLTYTNNLDKGRFQLKEATCPGINTATMFATATYLPMPKGVFYYVNANKIYTCKVNTLASSTAAAGLTFPAGTLIKAMKVFNSGYTATNITALGVPEGKVLVVATDETASGGGNKVYFYSLNATTGDISSTPADVYSGFEKITDIVFKKALGR